MGAIGADKPGMLLVSLRDARGWTPACRPAGRRLPGHVPGPFSLGRWAKLAIGVLACTVLVTLALSLPGAFHVADYVVLGGAVLATLWYFPGLRPRLEQPDLAGGEQAAPLAHRIELCRRRNRPARIPRNPDRPAQCRI